MSRHWGLCVSLAVSLAGRVSALLGDPHGSGVSAGSVS